VTNYSVRLCNRGETMTENSLFPRMGKVIVISISEQL
jgi:hypothetical protein